MTSPQEGQYPGRPPTGGYNPYGGQQRPPHARSAPLAPPAQRPRRPPQLLLAVGLLVLGALPWLALGVAFSALPLNVQGVLDSGALAGSPMADYPADDIAAAVRAAAAAAAVGSVVYLVLVGFTYGRRRWARILVTVFTAVCAVGLVFVLTTTQSPIVAALVAVPVVGAVLLFTRPVSAWFAS